MRKCFLHVGMHKTGTSSIQWMLSNHRADLAKHGFLYPRTGSGFPGHHNIAWEIAEHRYHDPQYGTVDELISEIGHSKQDVIISSEDFILAFPLLANFQSFIERLKQCGLRVVIVVYFRNPADYFRSAYFEILKVGCPVAFAPFISAMLENQTIRWGDHFAGGIDTVGTLRQIAADKDVGFIARSYDRARHSVVADFLSMINLKLADLGMETEARQNERAVIADAFGLFYQNRTGRSPDEREAWLISCLGAALDGDDIHMSDRAKQMLLARFEDEGQFLKQYSTYEFCEPETQTEDSITEADRRPCLEEVFSETTVRFIESTALRLPAEFQVCKSDGPAEVPAEVTQSRSIGRPSVSRRFWYRITPFLPSSLVSLARSLYHQRSAASNK